MNIFDRQSEGLLFQLQHIAHLGGLTESERFAHADTESVALMLEQAARFAQEHLVPLAEQGDLQGCRLENGRVLLPGNTREVWQQWCELGFPALSLPMEVDGLGFPRCVQSAVQELSDGANLAFGMLTITMRCATLALAQHHSSEEIQALLPGLASGALASTIAISEAQAGSDVGRILTSATQADDGSWRLTGSKLWISYADHDATDDTIHLVLARVPNGEIGTRGLGLFLVPGMKGPDGLQTNGISILRLEHKMGLHASPTCVMELQDSRGTLIGEPGRGLQALFAMMNPMRLAVAAQGAAVANSAALHALQYALDRPQGGHPLQPPRPIAEHPDVQRMLLEMFAQAELARAMSLRTAAMLDRAEALEGEPDAAQWQALGELLLPIAKTRNAEIGFQVASQGIQVLGGYGYTADYPIERMARDVRIASIYEGTSGIQALDFLKRKVGGDQGACLLQLLERITRETEGQQSAFSASLPSLCQLLKDALAALLQDELPAGHAEAGAYAFLQLSGLLIDAWNGHSLCCAASGTTAYEKRLLAALEHRAAALEEEARLWHRRTLQGLPEYRFAADDSH
ncbi:MAG TPA: acyl-CoA dehydrogenase [Pseudomonadaceae bacterium]|nr:acyl-CoA dehydrogenase [Pseudomonadaceae bacterium]